MPTPRHGYHLADGQEVPGCTTVLGMLALGPPASVLAAAAARLTREGRDYRADWDRKAELGTFIHDCIEREQMLPRPPWMSDKEWQKATVDFGEYMAWRGIVQPKFMHREVQLTSEKHRTGGTFDFLAEIGGVPTVGDHKTGSTVDVTKTAAQLAAYAEFAAEAGLVPKKPEHGVILHYTETGLKPININPEQMEHGFKIFLAARSAYDLVKQFPTRRRKG